MIYLSRLFYFRRSGRGDTIVRRAFDQRSGIYLAGDTHHEAIRRRLLVYFSFTRKNFCFRLNFYYDIEVITLTHSPRGAQIMSRAGKRGHGIYFISTKGEKCPLQVCLNHAKPSKQLCYVSMRALAVYDNTEGNINYSNLFQFLRLITVAENAGKAFFIAFATRTVEGICWGERADTIS